jgi:hypothetical protein
LVEITTFLHTCFPSMATMRSSSCNCPLSSLQRMSDNLSRESLPVDTILRIGSEFFVQLQTTIQCNGCIVTKPVSQVLSHITLRLICFYEAAYVDAIASPPSDTSSSTSSNRSDYTSNIRNSSGGRADTSLTSAIQQLSNCKSVARDMKLGNMVVDGLEGRLLVRVVLVDACIELNEKIQRWKDTMEATLGAEDQQYLIQYNAFIGRCIDRVANLIGLLRLDSLSKDHS